VRRFGAREIAPQEQKVESEWAFEDTSPRLSGKPKGERSMGGKQLNEKVGIVKRCKSCPHGEA
jgi:hypothetical protein